MVGVLRMDGPLFGSLNQGDLIQGEESASIKNCYGDPREYIQLKFENWTSLN
jgi:hypothetical protein